MARREHLDYIYRGLMSQHPRFAATEGKTVLVQSFNRLI